MKSWGVKNSPSCSGWSNSVTPGFPTKIPWRPWEPFSNSRRRTSICGPVAWLEFLAQFMWEHSNISQRNQKSISNATSWFKDSYCSLNLQLLCCNARFLLGFSVGVFNQSEETRLLVRGHSFQISASWPETGGIFNVPPNLHAKDTLGQGHWTHLCYLKSHKSKSREINLRGNFPLWVLVFLKNLMKNSTSWSAKVGGNHPRSIHISWRWPIVFSIVFHPSGRHPTKTTSLFCFFNR